MKALTAMRGLVLVLLGVGLVACSGLDDESDDTGAKAVDAQDADGSGAGAGGAGEVPEDGAAGEPEPTLPPGHPGVEDETPIPTLPPGHPCDPCGIGGAPGILDDETSAGAGGLIPASGGAPPTGDAGAAGACIAPAEAPPTDRLNLDSACLTCASESCSEVHEACISNPDCLIALYCANACPDAGCRKACMEPYPGGVSDLIVLFECLASNCPMCTE